MAGSRYAELADRALIPPRAVHICQDIPHRNFIHHLHKFYHLPVKEKEEILSWSLIDSH